MSSRPRKRSKASRKADRKSSRSTRPERKTMADVDNDEIAVSDGLMACLSGIATTIDDDDFIRAQYMVWEKGYRATTPMSARQVIDSAMRTDIVIEGVTRPTIALRGSVAGVDAENAGIWLANPRTIMATGETELVDDHIWLFMENLVVSSDGFTSFALRYGDSIVVQAAVREYERNGMRRLGVDSWLLLDQSTSYYDVTADRVRLQRAMFANPDSVVVRVTSDHDDTYSVWCKPADDFAAYQTYLGQRFAEMRENV